MDFVVHSIVDESESKLMIKMVSQCSFDSKFLSQRPPMKIRIEKCLEVFSEDTWTDSFVSVACYNLDQCRKKFVK